MTCHSLHKQTVPWNRASIFLPAAVTEFLHSIHYGSLTNYSALGKTSHKKNRFLSGIAQITSPPPPPNSGKLYNFFWTSKTTFLRVLQNQVTMITTMMWVIIVIIILVLLMILVLKMTKKYHIAWYWCQNIRDNMVEKRVKRFGQGPPPLFGQCPKEINFF